MAIFGWICIVIALVWVLLKMRVSYNSAGGTTMAVVYDAAMYPPLLAAFGLYWVLPNFEIEWPIWAFVIVAVCIAVVAGIMIRIAEAVGDKPL